MRTLGRKLAQLMACGLLAAIAIVAVPTAAQAGTVRHVCTRFGYENRIGIVAAHCVDIETFTNSEGDRAIRAWGQAFCLNAWSEKVVQCAGINQIIRFRDQNQSPGSAGRVTCGRYTGGACPAGGRRFVNDVPGLYAICGHNYLATVETTITLPEYDDEYSSGPWSTTYVVGC